MSESLNRQLKEVEEVVCGTPLELKVMYREDLFGTLPRLTVTDMGDWIDLFSAEDVDMVSGEYRIIKLGVCMQLPDGYEAHIATRSSTFKRWGILMANSHGIIDNSFSGTNDVWNFPALAMRDTHISKGDRICQFRLVKRMEPVRIIETKWDKLSRGCSLAGTGTGGQEQEGAIMSLKTGQVLYIAKDNGYGDVASEHVMSTGTDPINGDYFTVDNEKTAVKIPMGAIGQRYFTNKEDARKAAGLEVVGNVQG